MSLKAKQRPSPLKAAPRQELLTTEQIGFRDEAIEPPFEENETQFVSNTQLVKSGLFSVGQSHERPITALWLRTQALNGFHNAALLSDEAQTLWDAGLVEAAREKVVAAQECEWQGLLHGEKLLELAAGSSALPTPLVKPSGSDLAQYERFYERLIQRLEDAGELKRRETLFTERNNQLHDLWQEWDRSVTQDTAANYTQRKAEWQPRWDALYEQYLAQLREISPQSVSPTALPVHVIDRPPSVSQPGRRSTPFPMVSATQALFSACHVGRDEFVPTVYDDRAGLEYAQGENRVRVDHRGKPPAEMLNAHVESSKLLDWLVAGEEGKMLVQNLSGLDDLAWEVAALAVTAFYTRTNGNLCDTAFPLLIDDYFDWRGTPATQRTLEKRAEVRDRIELLASDAVKMIARTQLHLPNPKTGRKEATSVITQGSYLDGKTEFWITGQTTLSSLLGEPPDGYMTRLGSWAAPFVRHHVMMGVALKRLAEYNQKTQQWEKRIGWYLTFQMCIQAGKMQVKNVTRAGKLHTEVTPQHSLRMETVLDGAHISDWREIARVNPGRVVKQWEDALATLHQDGIIANPECLDGAWNGSDLKTSTGKLRRGGLLKMQKRRYLFRPAGELLEHVIAKNELAMTKRREAQQRRSSQNASHPKTETI